MNEELKPVVDKAEKQEDLEISPEQRTESPEDFHEQIVQESEGEVATFAQEGEAQLAQVEARAESVGVAIDPEDKEALQALDMEASAAQAQLAAEIYPPDPEEEEPMIPDPEDDEVAVENASTTENNSGMKERAIENQELLNEREASKKFLPEERAKLAQEIREERRAQRERLAMLRTNIDSALVPSEGTDVRQENELYKDAAVTQSREASALAGRLESSLAISEQDAEDEKENISLLIADSDGISSLKAKLREHYVKADKIAREKYESVQKSVEQTALRNEVFFVHTIQEREILRHNELSNIGSEASYEDDADILLSLEPTISASSVFSGRSEDGKVSGLWSDTGGFLIGGGDILHADRNDLDSRSVGIRERVAAKGSEKQSVADIDKAVSKRGENEMMMTAEGRQEAGTTYNEFIIGNPKVFGYFQPAYIEEDELFADGKYWAGDKSMKYAAEELIHIKKKLDRYQKDPSLVTKFTRETPELYQEKLSALQENIARYEDRFRQMAARGNPLYIMTQDRKVYEYLGIQEDGSLKIGSQLTPQDVATGRAGLPAEKRRELGEKVIEKRVFKKEETLQEAQEIVSSLRV